MNQEKFGRLIKEIRIKNNLTQQQFANQYNVTYQAVSKWENGKNMPDTALIKQISHDYNISMDNMLEGLYSHEKKKKLKPWIILSIILLILLVVIIMIISINKKSDFEFKTLESNCSKFNISGNIAYNDNQSAIYITNIQYCGGDDTILYKKVECNLYEANKNILKKINSFIHKGSYITLEDFFQKVTLKVDNYERTCKEYKNNSLYLIINATNKDDVITSYKVPLSLEDKCS